MPEQTRTAIPAEEIIPTEPAPTKLELLAAALATTSYSFAHHGWSRAPETTYGVWAEEGADDLVANGRHIERATVVTVDLFTRDASETPRTTVESALDSLGWPWRLDSINYESETGLIHLYWRVSVYG